MLQNPEIMRGYSSLTYIEPYSVPLPYYGDEVLDPVTKEKVRVDHLLDGWLSSSELAAITEVMGTSSCVLLIDRYARFAGGYAR